MDDRRRISTHAVALVWGVLSAALLTPAISNARNDAPAHPIQIVLVGDSTVTDNAGWGLGFRQFLTEGAECINT